MLKKENLKYKPRVAVDARPLSYGITGNSRYLAEVLQRLLRPDSPLEYYLYSNKPIHPVFNHLIGLTPTFIPSKLPGVLWLNFTMPSLVKKHRIDLFWGTLQLLPAFGLKIPTLVNYHDLNFKSAPETMTTANYWQHKILSPITLKKADKVLCLSQNTKNDILNFLPELEPKLEVVYPGVQGFGSVSAPEKTLPKNFLFSVGTLEPRKNLSTLVEAYLSLKKEEPNFPYPLVLAGRLGWKSEGLTSLLKEGGLEKDGIYFIENPDDSKLGWLYKNCSYFIFPSLHEGFGLPLLEAIRENKPCIVSDIPVFHEVLDEFTDSFVSPKNLEAWKNALSLAGKKGIYGRKPSRNDWSWDSTAKLVENSLVELWKSRKKNS
ncbi:glycosyltransferase family 4 protein [Leptospira licerasiae]|uniref:Glycosyltransferase, group 1 family protein n=1 Tax=Leptospira licerasiae str. MMD4847 TaxID=1049971 RepID=A0ABN0HE94_9LEPT|nr:glycosyltransferase family 1 protein [Leptospira licerasiae]EIE01261.1 glycosyltransferase, group 1 family protein [Leptospira licerasiae serovar Varillal str. VAR 010]EJZ43984.1 glycosyltransferase, group 1 family protein [Leptospira licerasiae str. MMD4847]